MTAHTVLGSPGTSAREWPRRHDIPDRGRRVVRIELPECSARAESHNGMLTLTSPVQGSTASAVIYCPGWALARTADGDHVDWAAQVGQTHLVLDPLGQFDRIPAPTWQAALARADTLTLSVADATRLVTPGPDRSLLARLHARLASSTVVLVRRSDASCLLIGGEFHFAVDVPPPPGWRATAPWLVDPLGAGHGRAYAAYRTCGLDAATAARKASHACLPDALATPER